MNKAKELFELGAEPVNIMAARLLWKSPWWAKRIELAQDVPMPSSQFLQTLAMLYYDRRRTQKYNVSGMQEFCHLATMAHNIRWEKIDDHPALNRHYLDFLKGKLSKVHWNPSINRYEFQPFRP